MAPPFENLYHKRAVAATATKACMICYKSTAVVLITPDSKDFFYICLGHLKDRNFAVPVGEDAAQLAERRKKEELDRLIAEVKKEYEEKQAKRKTKAKDKEKEKAKDEPKDAPKAKDDKEQEAADAKERDDKIKQLEKDAKPAAAEDTGPRIFNLDRNVFQMRLNRLRQAEAAKRHAELLRNPKTFPSVPSGDL